MAIVLVAVVVVAVVVVEVVVVGSSSSGSSTGSDIALAVAGERCRMWQSYTLLAAACMLQ